MSVIASAFGPVRAPAKINLALHVVGQRNDGYHLLESLVVFTRFEDRVTVARAEADQFVVTGPYGSAVPADGSNLVLRARDALRPALPRGAGFPVSISLEKNLPPASGIGGGSSDAAASLKGLAGLWGPHRISLEKIGLSLGADVPMCLSPSPALVSGIGEKVGRLPSFPPLFIMLVNPGVEVSTPAVFSRLKTKNNAGLGWPVSGDRSVISSKDTPTPGLFPQGTGELCVGAARRQNPTVLAEGSETASPAPPLAPSSGGDGGGSDGPRKSREALYTWLGETRNDLQAPALELAPVIGTTLEALRATQARFVRMSGSGATCFGLYDTKEGAEAAAAEIRRVQPRWFVVATETFAASGEDNGGN
jgi:4-diphosphocytidyl-2-C-methyl-D-erythritol kinase